MIIKKKRQYPKSQIIEKIFRSTTLTTAKHDGPARAFQPLNYQR